MSNYSFIEKTTAFSEEINIDIANNFFIFDEIDSTNFKAKKIAEEHGERSIVISKIQRKGRGRFDRTWVSPEGGLYFSIILKPNISPDKTTLLPLLASVAVCKTVNSYNINSKIKWPNDVRLNGKKIAGILLESVVERNIIDYVVLGIGVNLNINKGRFPKKLQDVSTSLLEKLGREIDYYEFFKNLLFNLNKLYNMFLDERFEEILDKWKQLSDTLGKKIQIKTSSEEITGIAHDLDESGFLIIDTGSGGFKKITSGDCFYFEEL